MSRIIAPVAFVAALVAGSVTALAQAPAAHDHASATALNLEGQPAPRLDGRLKIGTRVPSLDELKGKVVFLFFWAHWCVECRAESPVVAKLVDKYRAQGLAIIAPTQRYGQVQGGRPAPPDRELRYIIQIRDAHYRFLRDVPVPLSEANHKAYGAADAIPVHVLIDRDGVVRLHRVGGMSEDELDAAIRRLL